MQPSPAPRGFLTPACGVAVAVGLVVVLGACGPDADPEGAAGGAASEPSPPATTSPTTDPTTAMPGTPAPSAPSAAGQHLRVAAGDVVVDLAGDWPEDSAPRVAGTGASRTVSTGTGALPLTFSVDGGELVRHADGSVSVLDADGGSPVGGLTRPDGPATFRDVDPQHLELVGTAGTAGTDDDGATSGDGAREEVGTALGTAGVVDATWGEREGGRSLAVDATDWARSAGTAGVELVWAELVAADPEVDTATMRDQLVCHALGAPDKATWNLEPWRPDVGLVAVLAARCNPTDEG
ncbi:DUF2599 domain-containing protein [Isoptericola sp. AK164]|uniref:DUF2599 domain-containing protein n=1 Tax=Isoptericola sp. AK164 TaxID=3024246 RepID=UPI002418B946|nr:DUF2599 domain-containing protein [Isoptericola sp. AK164]